MEVFVLNGPENIDKIRMNESCRRCCPLAHGCPFPEDMESSLRSRQPFDDRMVPIHFFVVVRVQDDVHGVSLHDMLVGCHREDDPGVHLVGVHDDRPVELTERVSGLEIIEPDECPYFRPVTDDLPVVINMERPHIVSDDDHLLYLHIAHDSQCFEGFRLSGACVTDDQDCPRMLPFCHDSDHRPVIGHFSLLHDLYIVKGQDHFFQVSEISELIPVGTGGGEDTVFPVVIEDCRHGSEVVEHLAGNSEEIDGINRAFKKSVLGQFEEIA